MLYFQQNQQVFQVLVVRIGTTLFFFEMALIFYFPSEINKVFLNWIESNWIMATKKKTLVVAASVSKDVTHHVSQWQVWKTWLNAPSCPKAAQTPEIIILMIYFRLCLHERTNFKRPSSFTFHVLQVFQLYFTAVSVRGGMNVFIKSLHRSDRVVS